MKKRNVNPSPEAEVLRSLLNPGKKTKYTFGSEKDAKRFFDQYKRLISALPDFIRPK